MGRHSGRAAAPKPGVVRRAWRRLPEPWRARVWQWRQRWRGFWDRRHTPAGEWDARLPKDASNWTDDWWWGSFGVAAALRTSRRARGDLLPSHRPPNQETTP
jgi:hypothetical protein